MKNPPHLTLPLVKQGGTNEAWVLRNVDNPYETVVVLGWHDLAKARTLMQSVSWQMMLQEMGVVGVPEV